ncbi:MAG: hypothetical protein ACXADL_06960 [Candidatus Thorarchaeota archaeon]
MRKRNLILILLTVASLSYPAIASSTSDSLSPYSEGSHTFWMDPLSTQAFHLQCDAGDILSGVFVVLMDGDLFPGDQTKYDYWLLNGIDFLILDAENYALWLNGNEANVHYITEDVSELNWSVEIPIEDTWYAVYSNDSIYMKQIEGSINHSGQGDLIFLLLLIGIICTVSIPTLIFITKKKK